MIVEIFWKTVSADKDKKPLNNRSFLTAVLARKIFSYIVRHNA